MKHELTKNGLRCEFGDFHNFCRFAVLGVRVGRVAQVLAALSTKTTSDVVLLPRRENTGEVVSIAAV